MQVFGKTLKNVRKHRDIKLATTERRRNYLVSKKNDHTSKIFTKYLLVTGLKKTFILMNKPVYLWLSIPKPSKILMYHFCYDYVKPKYGEKLKLCYTVNIDILYINTDDVYMMFI